MTDNFEIEIKILESYIDQNKTKFYYEEEVNKLPIIQQNKKEYQNWLYVSRNLDYGFRIVKKQQQFGSEEVRVINIVVFIYKSILFKLKFDKFFETHFFSTKQKYNCVDHIKRNINNVSKLKIDSLENLKLNFNLIHEKFRVEVHEKMNLLSKKKNEIKIKNKLNFQNTKLEQLSKLDKDGNGIIDIIEGSDEFMKLFRKHQSVIKEFDKEYINHLVKISNYLKTKRSNIQEIFLEIRKTKNQSQLEENVGLLKNQIHTYEVVLFHSLSMITSIVEDDLITVNEIYEEFDKLKMFKTDHEKEVSQKLSDIGDGLSSLMYSINSMERNIVSGLNTLSYVTQDGFSDLNNSLTKELQSINSSIDTNNLLTGIQTYQLYKINKQTKGLIE